MTTNGIYNNFRKYNVSRNLYTKIVNSFGSKDSWKDLPILRKTGHKYSAEEINQLEEALK